MYSSKPRPASNNINSWHWDIGSAVIKQFAWSAKKGVGAGSGTSQLSTSKALAISNWVPSINVE